MAIKTLTAANSVYLLAIADLYPVAQKLEGYATDDAFSVEDIAPAEVVKGVDGKMSGAFLPTVSPQTIVLQADSPSIDIFENWLSAQKAAREIMYASATILLPAVGKKYACSKGVLTKVTQHAGVKKTLGPQTYQITWDDISPAAVL